MHAAVVEGIPPAARRAGAETLEVGLVGHSVENVVLAGRIADVEARLVDDLGRVIKLLRLRSVGDVAGVNHEGRLFGERADLGDRLLEGLARIGVGGLVEADMAVGNLGEGEAGLLGFGFADQPREGHAAR